MSDDTNPKDILGQAKPSMQCVPEAAILFLGAAMEYGAMKYGARNWRDKKVLASVYLDAMERHRLLVAAGEDIDDESKLPHLAHIMAGCAILIDAQMSNQMVDDRKGSAEGIRVLKDAMGVIQQRKLGWKAVVQGSAKEALVSAARFPTFQIAGGARASDG